MICCCPEVSCVSGDVGDDGCVFVEVVYVATASIRSTRSPIASPRAVVVKTVVVVDLVVVDISIGVGRCNNVDEEMIDDDTPASVDLEDVGPGCPVLDVPPVTVEVVDSVPSVVVGDGELGDSVTTGFSHGADGVGIAGYCGGGGTLLNCWLSW